MYQVDLKALEHLRNKSICVLENNGIRNIHDEDDLHSKNLVYVNNISPIESEPLNVIHEGLYVRYKKINDPLVNKLARIREKVKNKQALDYDEFKKSYKENMSGYGDLIQTSEAELVKMYVATVTLLQDIMMNTS